jgi:hypothetical protein
MKDDTKELAVIESQTIGSTAMMFGAGNLERAMQVAEAMASAKVSVPNHLRGNPGDCLAIVMQATQWGMNPFAVAQKTHLVNGTLGYEAQLVNAVVQGSGSIKGRIHYDYRGEGANIECRVGAVIAGETDVTWGEWLASKDVQTKNSPLWKTNPKQQLGYLQMKNWARLYCPGAILGVYDYDELANAPATKDMGNIDRGTGDVTQDGRPGITPCPDSKIDDQADKWQKNIADGKITAEAIIKKIQTMHTLTDEQIKRINDLELPPIEAEYTQEQGVAQ